MAKRGVNTIAAQDADPREEQAEQAKGQADFDGCAETA